MKNKTAIIGAGAAGVMAALRCVLNNDHCILYTGDGKNRKKSRAQWVSKIENMPGYFHFKYGIRDPNKETIEFIKSSPFANNLELKKNTSVTSVEKIDGGFKIIDSKGNSEEVEYAVLGTGVMDIQPTINGDIQEVLPYANIQLVDYCLRCDGHHVFEKDTVIVGDGAGAIWVAIMLYERYETPSMTVITNGAEFEVSEELKELSVLYGITVLRNKVTGLRGNAKEHMLEGYELDNGDFIKAQMSFVSMGMIVYNELLKPLEANLDNRGFALTSEKGETNIENLYVIGDLRAGLKKQIYTAWDSAVDSLDHINGKIRVNKRKELLKNNKNNTI
jgi:thioredoxin reductase (NADPH)